MKIKSDHMTGYAICPKWILSHVPISGADTFLLLWNIEDVEEELGSKSKVIRCGKRDKLVMPQPIYCYKGKGHVGRCSYRLDFAEWLLHNHQFGADLTDQEPRYLTDYPDPPEEM